MQSERRFIFDLALRLKKTVAEIEKMPSGELTGWMAYFKLQQKEQLEKEAAMERARTEASKRNMLTGGSDGGQQLNVERA